MAKHSREEDVERWLADHDRGKQVPYGQVKRAGVVIADLFCTFRTFRDALRYWAVDTPKRLPPALLGVQVADLQKRLDAAYLDFDLINERRDDSREWKNDAFAAFQEYHELEEQLDHVRRWEDVPLRKKVSRPILLALGQGSGDLASAARTLFEQSEALRNGVLGDVNHDHSDAQMRVAWQLKNLVFPLLQAYADPAVFFREVVPALYPDDFEPAKIGPFANSAHFTSHLGNTLAVWGYGALLNPKVLAAFTAEARPPVLNLTISEAQSRIHYDPEGGRRTGSRDRKRRKRRTDDHSTTEAQWAIAGLSQGTRWRSGQVERAKEVVRRLGIDPDSLAPKSRGKAYARRLLEPVLRRKADTLKKAERRFKRSRKK